MDRILFTILIVAMVALLFALIDMRRLPKISTKDLDRWIVVAAISQTAVLVAVAVAVYRVMT